MVKSLRGILTFRVCALLYAIAGLMAELGVFKGTIKFMSFMYYTIQSNILAIIMFALLVIHTIDDMRGGVVNDRAWLSRLKMIFMVDLLVTMIVFWVFLAPIIGPEYLWTFENFSVHMMTPLLCLIDYTLFYQAGHLKYRDVYLICVFPLCYIAFTVIARLAGFVYYYETVYADGTQTVISQTPIRYPYFFLDFDTLGAYALVYISGIVAFFLLLGHCVYWIDLKKSKRLA